MARLREEHRWELSSAAPAHRCCLDLHNNNDTVSHHSNLSVCVCTGQIWQPMKYLYHRPSSASSARNRLFDGAYSTSNPNTYKFHIAQTPEAKYTLTHPQQSGDKIRLQPITQAGQLTSKKGASILQIVGFSPLMLAVTDLADDEEDDSECCTHCCQDDEKLEAVNDILSTSTSDLR